MFWKLALSKSYSGHSCCRSVSSVVEAARRWMEVLVVSSSSSGSRMGALLRASAIMFVFPGAQETRNYIGLVFLRCGEVLRCLCCAFDIGRHPVGVCGLF